MLTLVVLHSQTNERCARNDTFEYHLDTFLFDTLRQLIAYFRKNVFCILASFDVSFHHSSRFGSTQIQSKKEPCGACPGMLMRPNVLITFPCVT